MSDTVSMTPSEASVHRKVVEEEKREQAEFDKHIKATYVSILDKDEKRHASKMVGLNPN